MSGQDVIAVYDAQAAELADRYDRIGLLEAFAGMSELIAPAGSDPLALDVGGRLWPRCRLAGGPRL